MSIYYCPEEGILGDVIPFYDNGVFKPFFLKNYRNSRIDVPECNWFMLSTTDHIHYQEHDTKIAGGTGSVIKADGLYHMFYCTFPKMPERNYINHAVSTDLVDWTEIKEDRFRSDDRIYAPVHWRDPFVFWVEEEQCWWMILAAQKNGPTSRRSCVGLCKSTDLHHWDYCEPFYAPMDAQCAFECPDLFYMNGWWYLVYSSYADRFQTLYRRSRSLYGPWEIPEIDTFDTRAFYAAKTGSDGVHRYIYGWNPTRELNSQGFDPLGYEGKDCKTWDWGGCLVVHELWQDDAGNLFVKPLREALDYTGAKRELCLAPLTGDWQTDEERGTASVDNPYGYSALLLNQQKETSRISMDVEVAEGTAAVGLAIHTDEDFSLGYYIHIDLFRRRMEFKSGVRMTERGGQMFPYEVELERPLSSLTGNCFHVDLIASGTVLEAYVDQRVVLGSRMFDLTGGNFGLYVDCGSARFTNITVSGLQNS